MGKQHCDPFSKDGGGSHAPERWRVIDIHVANGKATLEKRGLKLAPPLAELVAEMDRIGWENEPATVDWAPTSARNAFTIITEVQPSAGDFYLANLDPATGSEQAGTRPVIVISAQMMNIRSMRVIVCPITSNMQPWMTKIALPAGLETRGVVLADQIRAIDKSQRLLRRVEGVPEEFLLLVRSYLAASSTSKCRSQSAETFLSPSQLRCRGRDLCQSYPSWSAIGPGCGASAL